jgi:hypothetical protein
MPGPAPENSWCSNRTGNELPESGRWIEAKRKVGDLPQPRLMWPAHIVQSGAKCGA